MDDSKEDIEILEELIEEYKDCSVEGLDMQVDVSFREKQCNAIEHLIKGYRELEYKYDKALSDLVQAEHKNKELEEENRTLKRANSIAEDISIEDITQVMNKAYKDFIKEFIPTSLVKEKIEELKEREELLSDEQGYWGGSDLFAKIEVLQDLLERSREDE